MELINRGAITVLGTEDFLQWVKEVRADLQRWDLDSLNHHPNVYLIEEEDQNNRGKCFEKHHRKIFENEVGEYVRKGESRPDVSLELFRRWFRCEYHELVYDLTGQELEIHNE